MQAELRTLAEFRTDIPDETVEEDGQIVTFGGRGVAFAIRDLLNRPDRQVQDPEDEQECGWRFLVRTRRRTFFCQVQFIDQVLLTTDDVTIPSVFGKVDQTEFRNLLVELNEAMLADGRFHDIRWCTEAEIFGKGPGAPTPLG